MTNIYITGHIKPQTLEDVARQLDEDSRSVTVYINSGGGDAFTGLGIYDLLKSEERTVNVIGVGLVASAAAMIFMAGDNRILSANSEIMFHKSSTSLGYTQGEDLLIEGNALKRIDKRIDKLISPLLKETQLKAFREGRDVWLTEKQARKQGIVNR